MVYIFFAAACLCSAYVMGMENKGIDHDISRQRVLFLHVPKTNAKPQETFILNQIVGSIDVKTEDF